MNSPDTPMRSVQPLEGFPAPIGSALWSLQDCRRRTLTLIDGVTPEVLYWTPPSPGNTIASLLYHVAAIEADWLFTEILEQEIPTTVLELFPFDVRDDLGQLTSVSGLDLAQLMQDLATVRAALTDSLTGMPLGEFRRVRTFEKYKISPEWVLHHLAMHEAEHRGQIADLRRRAEVAQA